MSYDAPEEAVIRGIFRYGIAFRPGGWHLLVVNATRVGLEPTKSESQPVGYPLSELACIGEKLACADDLLRDNRVESALSEIDPLACVGTYYKPN